MRVVLLRQLESGDERRLAGTPGYICVREARAAGLISSGRVTTGRLLFTPLSLTPVHVFMGLPLDSVVKSSTEYWTPPVLWRDPGCSAEGHRQ